MKTFRSPAKPLPCLADRDRRTRTPDSLDVSQLLDQLSYVPMSTRPRTGPDGYLVLEQSLVMAIRNQCRRPGGPLASFLFYNEQNE